MLTACSAALPPEVVGNDYFEANLETTSDWIVQRTGIRTRHVLSDAGGSLLQLAMRCAIDACRVSGRVDLVIVASSTPDDAFGDACSIAARLYEAGLATADCPAFDVRSACCGFVDALAIASAMAYERACIVGCDALASQLVDWTDRSTAVLFGDAAAAVVLESRARATALLRGFPGVDRYPRDALVAKKSTKHRQLTYEPMRMRGAEVFAFATESVPQAIQDAMRDAGWHSPPDHVVLHQANARIVKAVATSLGLDEAKCTTSSVERHGNTGAASIPLALAQLPLRPGQRVVVAAFGAGPRVSVVMLYVGEPTASTVLPPTIANDDGTTNTTAPSEDDGGDSTQDIVVRTLAMIFSVDVQKETVLRDLAPDSLSSMEFATRLEAETGIKVERMILLNDRYQTAEELCIAIERSQGDRRMAKPSALQPLNVMPDDGTSFEVTSLQHAMLFHHVRSKECLGSAFVASFSWRVADGSLSNAPIDEAWRATSQRHEALRSSFEFVDGGWPKQRAWPQISEDECFCERAILDDSAGVRRVAARQRQAILRALDQGRPHLARLALVNSSADGKSEETLVATFHHLVIDGISLCVIFEDLQRALQGKVVAALPPRWRDFAAAATMVDPALVAESQRYYADSLAASGVPGTDRFWFSPNFDPHRNRIRTTRRTRGGCCRTLSGSSDLAAIVHTAFLTAFDALGVGCIESYSATFATRYHRTGFARLVGPALNTVPLKNHLIGQPSFDAAVRRISNALAEASRLAEVPLDDMRRCSTVPPPQVIFDFQGSRRTWISSGSALWGDAKLKDGCILNDSAGVALSVRCVRDGDEFVLIAVSESPDIDRGLLCRIIGAFDVCLQCVAHGINDRASPSLSLLAFAVELGDRRYNNDDDHHAYVEDNVDKSLLRYDISQSMLQTETTLQDVLRQAVAAELRIDQSSLDPDANLFSIGVDSLKAMRILAKCTQGTFNGLTLRHFFETPTIRGLASRGAPESKEGVLKEVLASAAETAPFELLDNDDEDDEAQCPLFGVSAAHFVGLHTTSVGSFEPISPQICWEWEIDNLDVGSFEAAWQDVIERHTILRSFVTQQGTLQPLGRHWQGAPEAVLRTSRRTICQSSSSVEFDAAVADQRDFFESGRAIGSVFEWPLFAFGVVETPFTSVVHVAMSLFLMDAVADNTFRAELSELYIAHKTGRAALLRPAPKLDFSRYARSLLASSKNSQAYADGREFWTRRLADPAFPRSGPILYSQKEKAAARFEHFSFELSAAQWRTLRSNCVANGTTIPAALLAAYALALARHSEHRRFLINVLLCIRYDVHEDVLRTIGNCSSNILVDIDLTDAQLTLKATVAKIAASLAASLDHSIFSGIEVMALVNRKKRTTYDAVAPFIFTTPIGIEACLPDDYVRTRKWAFRETRFSERAPHSACVNAIKDDPVSNGAHASLDILAELFPASLTASVVESYRFALVELSQSTPWASRRMANFYSEFSLEQAPTAVCRHPSSCTSHDGHDTVGLSLLGAGPHIHRLGLSGAALLHDALFRNASHDHCSICPGVVFDPCTQDHSAKNSCALVAMSYSEVASKALRLAQALANEGFCDAMTDTALIGVVMQKCWKQVVAVHAILVQGCAYLPIDAKLWPAKRVSSVLRDSNAALAVVDAIGSSLIDMSLVTCRVLDVDAALLSASTLPNSALTEVLGKPRDETTTAWRAAYVIYTSGSTGRPKGVVCHHFGAINTVADLVERWRIEAGDRILGLASLAFDLSVFDIFGATMACAALVLPSAEDVSPPNPTAWLDLARKAKVTIWNSVPALLELTIVSLDLLVLDRSVRIDQVQGHHEMPGSLRLVFLSGDVVPPMLPARAVSKCGRKVQIVLMGGATEAAIWSNEFVVPANDQEPMLPIGWSSWPYGTPLYGQTLEVLDDATHDSLPAWTVGPIYIGGVGVALGYHLDPALTHRQFVQRKRPPGDGLFRTGDLGRLRPGDDGSWLVEILGREDSQVKLRGNRVELGEVDTALASLPGVLAAASVIRDEILVAFVVLNGGRPERLTPLLAANLPKYMIPARIISIDALPLSSNGKVLREKLPRLVEEARRPRQQMSPVEARNDVERRIGAAFARHLNGHRICCETTDFFQAGGSSLSGIRLVAELNHEFGRLLSPRDLLKNPTVAGLAVALAEPDKSDEADSIFQALPLSARGTDALLVLFNPAGASGLCYVPLAAALADSFSVLALDDGVVSGRTSELPFNSIGAAARHAAHLAMLLRRKHEAQVFLLGGWSYGGVLALEIAKIIHDVDGLVLLDAPVFGAVVDGRQSQHDEPRANRHFFDATELLNKYYQGDKHRTDALKCPLLNLWPRDTPAPLHDSKEKMSRLTCANTTLDYLPADHWTMLDEGSASVAATRIRAWFKAEFVAPADTSELGS